jgi:hypothetical protein
MRRATIAALVGSLALVGLGSFLLLRSDTAAATVRSLDGRSNNLEHLSWGRAGTNYLRLSAARYADGIAQMVEGPHPRYVSNRIFNDSGQNLFSENGVSQWGWVWGQFIDHDFGLRDEEAAERVPIAFNNDDPLEAFTNDLRSIAFSRTPAAPGTGDRSSRQQINTISSFIDASSVYGTTKRRLDWLRAGGADGDPANNAAALLLPEGYLPRADARGRAASAPTMELVGRLIGAPARARVAGDIRANENLALTAAHTLFAREHNRIVAVLPASLPEETRFEIARRIVGAEVQYVTYKEFLPALGVALPTYRGYNPRVNAGLSNEFAVVGYRAHSMVQGRFDVAFEEGEYSAQELRTLKTQGIEIGEEDRAPVLKIPLSVAFANPDLLPAVGLGPFLRSLGADRMSRNDEQIDDTLRSILFGVPKPGVRDPAACQQPVVDPDCFAGVQDLGAVDLARGRDHGMPPYNELRRALGLAPQPSFTAITGEATDRFPNDPAIDRSDPLDDPDILDVVQLSNRSGEVLDPGSAEAEEEAVAAVRRTTLAARLKAIYGTVDRVDAFVGMMSESHVAGTEFGELQLALWKRQFQALRDGDRFFYANDPELSRIEREFGVTFRRSLAAIIEDNTDAEVAPKVFAAVGG